MILRLLRRQRRRPLIGVVHHASHALELLLQSLEHRLRDLELDSAWMLPDGEGVLGEVLDEELVLEVIRLLSHLYDHVLLVRQPRRFRAASILRRLRRARVRGCLLLVHIQSTRLLILLVIDSGIVGGHRGLRIRSLKEVSAISYRSSVRVISRLPDVFLRRELRGSLDRAARLRAQHLVVKVLTWLIELAIPELRVLLMVAPHILAEQTLMLILELWLNVASGLIPLMLLIVAALINTILILIWKVLALPRLCEYAAVVAVLRVVLCVVSREGLVFRHLVNLISNCVGSIGCLIDLFVVVLYVHLGLITILKPIVEVVAKLLQEVHVAGVVSLLVFPP